MGVASAQMVATNNKRRRRDSTGWEELGEVVARGAAIVAGFITYVVLVFIAIEIADVRGWDGPKGWFTFGPVLVFAVAATAGAFYGTRRGVEKLWDRALRSLRARPR